MAAPLKWSWPSLARAGKEIWLWESKPFWHPIFGFSEFTTHFRTYTVVVGFGCSLGIRNRDFDPWPECCPQLAGLVGPAGFHAEAGARRQGSLGRRGLACHGDM